jgi:hypothetical protein
MGFLGDIDKGEPPLRHAGVGTTVHTVNHHAPKETLRLPGITKNLRKQFVTHIVYVFFCCKITPLLATPQYPKMGIR